MQQDFLLVRKMKNGDEEAMDIFVRKYYPKILQYCFYHCADRELAQDLTQETFARFFSALADYRHSGRALNYLYTIARNLCIDQARKRREEGNRESMAADECAEKVTDAGEVMNGGDGGIGRMDEKLLLEDALKKLPDELLEVVILHYFHEYSLREVAALLNIGLPLVKYRIKRAKELLREQLEK